MRVSECYFKHTLKVKLDNHRLLVPPKPAWRLEERTKNWRQDIRQDNSWYLGRLVCMFYFHSCVMKPCVYILLSFMCDEAMRMRERHTYQKWSESHCSCVLSGNSSHLHHPSWTHLPSHLHHPSQYNDGHKSTLLPMRGHTSHHHHWRGRTHIATCWSRQEMHTVGRHPRCWTLPPAPSMLDPPTRTLDAGPTHPSP